MMNEADRLRIVQMLVRAAREPAASPEQRISAADGLIKQGLTDDAIQTLREVLGDPSIAAPHRTAAARLLAKVADAALLLDIARASSTDTGTRIVIAGGLRSFGHTDEAIQALHAVLSDSATDARSRANATRWLEALRHELEAERDGER